MFGIGMPEMILILAVALIVLGPKKLPDLAKSLGRAVREFKSATSEFKESMAIDSDLSDVKQSFDDINQDIRSTVDFTSDSSNETKTDAGADSNAADDGGASDADQGEAEADLEFAATTDDSAPSAAETGDTGPEAEAGDADPDVPVSEAESAPGSANEEAHADISPADVNQSPPAAADSAAGLEDASETLTATTSEGSSDDRRG